MFTVRFYDIKSADPVEIWTLSDERITSNRMKLIYFALQNMMSDRLEDGMIVSAVVQNMRDGKVALAVMERLIGTRVYRMIACDACKSWHVKEYGLGGIQ